MSPVLLFSCKIRKNSPPKITVVFDNEKKMPPILFSQFSLITLINLSNILEKTKTRTITAIKIIAKEIMGTYPESILVLSVRIEFNKSENLIATNTPAIKATKLPSSLMSPFLNPL